MIQFDDLIWLLLFCQNFDALQFEISTIDNPGFSVSVDLLNTPFVAKIFDDLEINRSEHDWVYCCIRNGKFEGACGPMNLSEVLSIFRTWIEGKGSKESEILKWLMRWYSRHCDGDWEHEYRLKIQSLNKSNCQIVIDLARTECENQKRPPAKFEQSSLDDITVTVENEQFCIQCDLIDISHSLEVFKEWSSKFQDISDKFENCQKEISRDQIPHIIEKLELIFKIIELKKVENVILFRDRLHLVFEGTISLDIYAKIETSNNVFLYNHCVVKYCELFFPSIKIVFSGNEFILIDLNQTYDGGFVRLELKVPKKNSFGPEWTHGTYEGQPSVLFI